MKWLLSLFTGGFSGYALVAGFVAFLSIAGSTFIVKNIYEAKLAQAQTTTAELKASYAERDASSVSASLAQLQSFIGGMHAAELSFQSLQSNISAQFSAIAKDIKDAPPIPNDCVIDAVRLRALDNATTAANSIQRTSTPK